MTPEEIYRELLDGVKGIVCPCGSMFENAAGFEIEDIRARLQALVAGFDSGMLLFINLEREHHHEIINATPNPALNERMGNRVYIVRACDDDGKVTCLSVKQCSGNQWNSFTFDLLAAQKRVDYIRRYCPTEPAKVKTRDELVLYSVSALNVCLNVHVAGGKMRLLDLAALDELLFLWCQQYGKYQFLEMKIEEINQNQLTCVLYTQHPKTFNTGFLIQEFENGLLVERGLIDNNRCVIQAIIDPATLPIECKVIQLSDNARKRILATAIDNVQPPDKSIYEMKQYNIDRMRQLRHERNESCFTACTLFALTVLGGVSLASGQLWRYTQDL